MRLTMNVFVAAAFILAANSVVSAQEKPLYATVVVAAQATAIDGGVAIPPNAQVRITGGGSIQSDVPFGGCAGPIGPRGCATDAFAKRPQIAAPAGALLATFVDAHGAALSPAFFVGEGAVAIAPNVASRLVFRMNAYYGSGASGAFVVTTALATTPVAPIAALPQIGTTLTPAQASAQVASARNALGRTIGKTPRLGGAVAAAATPRYTAQFMARRLGFGAPPAQITAIVQQGPQAWLAQQLAPAAIDDSAALATLQPKPDLTDANGNIIDPDGFERRLIERQFATKRQVLEKMVMHWIDHFAVGNAKVNDASLMSHYEETLRTDALGNFKQLLVDVAQEPAMLYWLDNDGNNGANPKTNPPNENFSRELMQLYVLGTTKLNMDGSQVVDTTGAPVANYTQTDVTTAAAALSGFKTIITYAPNQDPNTRFSVAFSAARHGAATQRTLLGVSYADPGTAQCLDAALDVMVRNPSTAPFQARELIQRFVEPNPSPRYVAAVASVWAATVDAPDQLAQVVKAMASDPEFGASYDANLKDPTELLTTALREVGGKLLAVPNTALGTTTGGGAQLAGAGGLLAAESQEPYNAPSVFSFYYPGHKEMLFSQQLLLTRINNLTTLLGNNVATASTSFDTVTLATQMPTNAAGITQYLLDALVDGGTPALSQSVLTYLGNGIDDAHIRGAIWLIVSSPEYEVA